MEFPTWQIVVIIIAQLPAAIAALSSLRNGRLLKELIQHRKKVLEAFVQAHQTKTQNGVSKDWYQPPDLD